MPTQAKKDGNARHIAKLDIIKIQPYKEEGTAIRAAAAAASQSVQGYILQAVRERMNREQPPEAAQRPAEPYSGSDMSCIGTVEKAAQGAPRDVTEGAGGHSDSAGAVSIFSDKNGTPTPASCPISHPSPQFPKPDSEKGGDETPPPSMES